MSLVLIIVVVCVLLNCGTLFQWNAFGHILDFVRNAQYQQNWDKWYRQELQPATLSAQQAAESLGSIGNTTQMAADQYARATSLAGGLSNQATRDVNQRFDQLGASGQALLRSRGIGGSTVAPSLAYANERNRSDELRRVNDERINTLLGVESAFGGAKIAASQEAQSARAEFYRDRYFTPPAVPVPFVGSGRRA